MTHEFTDDDARDFEGLYWDFVNAGGLNSTLRIDEGWERHHRMTTHCTHGLERQKCETCYRPPKDYYPQS